MGTHSSIPEILAPLEVTSWQEPGSAGTAYAAAGVLESGRLLYAPRLAFELLAGERRFFLPDYLAGKSKNVSFRPQSGVLGGTRCEGREREELLAMLRRYYEQASALVQALLPGYGDHLTAGFTSFRPAEIAGRATSWRHDDTRLHVDAFPSRPTQGTRILRVFSNANPERPRIWRVGEPFADVAARFLPKTRTSPPAWRWLLHRLRITKTRRTEYDHIMLTIHDRMKADMQYQRESPQTELAIPPGATWACFTDSVSHAAMSGQFAFEQTFYLPVKAMRDPAQSPLRVLERLAGRPLG